MGDKKRAYHITKKSNLYSIQKNGLQPRIGRRSNSVDEYEKSLYFTDNLYSIFTWKKRLYGNEPFENYAILTFDIDDTQYTRRYDSAGDCFIKKTILPENIKLFQINEKNMQQNTDSLAALEDIFSTKMFLEAIEIMSNNYEVSEQPITELSIEKPTLDNNEKKETIEKLADYEHKKWSEEYNQIDWKANKNEDGSLEISEEDIEQMQKYGNLDYEQVEEFYKKDIQSSVMETFFIMQEHNIINYLGIEDEDIISTLEQIEYMRRNRWSKYMLSVCSINDGKYVIPAEKAELWEEEMRTPYSELSEKQKESDRKEVYTIFSEVEKYRLDRQKLTPLQDREAELTRLEEEQQAIEKEEDLIEQENHIGQ